MDSDAPDELVRRAQQEQVSAWYRVGALVANSVCVPGVLHGPVLEWLKKDNARSGLTAEYLLELMRDNGIAVATDIRCAAGHSTGAAQKRYAPVSRADSSVRGYRVNVDQLFAASYFDFPERNNRERTLETCNCTLVDEDVCAHGLVQLLQASCKIHRVPMHRVIEPTAGPDVAGDYFSGRDANTGTQ